MKKHGCVFRYRSLQKGASQGHRGEELWCFLALLRFVSHNLNVCASPSPPSRYYKEHWKKTFHLPHSRSWVAKAAAAAKETALKLALETLERKESSTALVLEDAFLKRDHICLAHRWVWGESGSWGGWMDTAEKSVQSKPEGKGWDRQLKRWGQSAEEHWKSLRKQRRGKSGCVTWH